MVPRLERVPVVLKAALARVQLLLLRLMSLRVLLRFLRLLPLISLALISLMGIIILSWESLEHGHRSPYPFILDLAFQFSQRMLPTYVICLIVLSHFRSFFLLIFTSPVPVGLAKLSELSAHSFGVHFGRQRQTYEVRSCD